MISLLTARGLCPPCTPATIVPRSAAPIQSPGDWVGWLSAQHGEDEHQATGQKQDTARDPRDVPQAGARNDESDGGEHEQYPSDEFGGSTWHPFNLASRL